jgi:hypothetical protein
LPDSHARPTFEELASEVTRIDPMGDLSGFSFAELMIGALRYLLAEVLIASMEVTLATKENRLIWPHQEQSAAALAGIERVTAAPGFTDASPQEIQFWSTWRRETALVDGPYDLVLIRVEADEAVRKLAPLFCVCMLGIPPREAEALVANTRRLGPQVLLSGISREIALELRDKVLGTFGFVSGVRDKSGHAITSTEPGPSASTSSRGREAIPAQVRREVWRRDQGRCVDCGSRERLEYDHIIPVSRGGSNTVRNIELRCESCNRKKGARV